MKPNGDREIIDAIVLEEIKSTLVKYGVPTEKTERCYDSIRFRVEARAVLLNRVPERDNDEVGYYGTYLKETAQEHGVKYEF